MDLQNIIKVKMTENYWMDFMNVFYALVVLQVVQVIGGIQIDT